ncbi:CBS domain-containing protein [Oceaniglobus indicus]|uniref:CBS domain-containing protein n=1 Tax=Oceaniglobus indicus TaxID=2047749 RepID=UPI000C18D2F3|nr:CBS domain-containing protein [Oceaniglobus indicus]
MRVRQVMRARVSVATPATSIHAVAALLKDRDIGMVPVMDNGRPVGVVTDRDLTIRLLTETGWSADGPVSRIMTPHVHSCGPDVDVVEAARLMGEYQVRRLVVCDSDGTLVGIVSLGDIARDASEELAGQALGEIVEYR